MDPAQVSALNAGLVSLLCAIIAAASWRAMQRTGNRAIGYVVAAFVLLSLKNLVKALTLASLGDETGWHEFAFSLADLVAVGLIAWPLLLRRGKAPE
jgi:hypothetical protein